MEAHVTRDRSDMPLPLYQVLEEEFAALHPEAGSVAPMPTGGFAARDVADVAGFAKALEPAHTSHEHEPVRPPAPAGTPLHAAARFVLAGQDTLAEALRQYEVTASDANMKRLGAELAARLTRMLALDLAAEPAYAPFAKEVESVVAQLGSAVGDRAQRNRVIIELAFEPYLVTTRDTRLEAIFFKIHHARHAALCLSGGGIRSASFAMGIVQGLARHGLLPRFDYLSTVSGGGYTGGWLSAWMARAGAAEVWKQLKGVQTPKLDDEPAPVKHVRKYSHYLNASFGAMSADTWTITATVMRNILLIWLVTMPLMAAGLMLPRFFVSFPMTTIDEWKTSLGWDPGWLTVVLYGLATILLIRGAAYAHGMLHERPTSEDGKAKGVDRSLGAFHWNCLIPLIVGLICLVLGSQLIAAMFAHNHPGDGALSSLALANMIINSAPPSAADLEVFSANGMAVYGAFVGIVSWLIGTPNRWKKLDEGFVMGVASAVAGYGVVIAFDALIGVGQWKHGPEFWATFAVPLFLSLLLLGSQLFIGFTSKVQSDSEREAAARFNAWLLIVIVGWIGMFGVALYGPRWFKTAVNSTQALVALAGSGAGAGIITALIGAAASAPAAGSNGSGGLIAAVMKGVTAVAVPFFAVAVAVLIAVADGRILKSACDAKPDWCPADANALFDNYLAPRAATVVPGADSSAVAPPSTKAPAYVRDTAVAQMHFLQVADYAQPQMVLVTSVVLLGVGLLIGLFIDTNRFSLHAMYKQRLTRTFLGASKAPCDRDPDPFTGFDETDDMPMGDLWPARRPPGEQSASGGGAANMPSIRPPMHILNLALNLVGSSRLGGGTQDRKAECFTVSSLHAGSARVGYRRTSVPEAQRSARTSWIGKVIDERRAQRARVYGGRDGITLGTAVAVSGAAASPNMGYNSSPAITFLMTLFNARMGWWLGNPGAAGDDTYFKDEPTLGVVPILNEMFGRTTDTSPYVYLSDGGHFENLAVYEMIRRRCRFIVVSDAGKDAEHIFDDLGGLVRKARIDFGVPVEFSPKMNIFPRSMPDKAKDGTYWAIGRIRYSAVDKDPEHRPGESDDDYDGIIVYVKAAYYGNEPRDVYNYAQKVPEFPHDSTANQFFGEAQVESYRALGEYAVDQMWAKDFNLAADSDGLVPKAALDGWVKERLKNWSASG